MIGNFKGDDDMSLSKQLENEFDFYDNESPRIASISFYQRIIEDLTGHDVKGIAYNSDLEFIVVNFTNRYLPQLSINVTGDSLQACTCDVIRQTQAWIEEQRKKSQVD